MRKHPASAPSPRASLSARASLSTQDSDSAAPVVSGERDRRFDIPLYRQIERYLRRQIESGACQPGDLIPSVDSLRAQFGGINHLTVRQAIKILVDEGLVESVRGRGTFVTKSALRNRHVALVLPHLDETFHARIAQGAQRVLEDAGLMTVIFDSNHNFDKESDHLRSLRDLPLGGAIIFPLLGGGIAEQIIRLKNEGFPAVLVDRHLNDVAMPTVEVDNYRGSYEITQHVLQKGRTRLAWIGAVTVSSAIARLNGFRDALSDGGLPLSRNLILTLDDERSNPVEAIGFLLKTTPRPDAIVCCNDIIAFDALRTLRKKRVKVPEDIAVVGFDDLPQAARSTPPLTTVRQPMEQVGEEAARLLLERMANPHLAPQVVTLPVELIARESV